MPDAIERYGLDARLLAGDRALVRHGEQYAIECRGDPQSGALDGLRISRAAGRFGNNLAQLSNAVKIAHALGVPTVAFTRMKSVAVRRPTRFEAVSIIGCRPDDDLPGAWLSGRFFYTDTFPDLAATLDDPSLDLAIAESALREIFLQKVSLPEKLARTLDNAVVVHIRSGDLFTNPAPHPKYVQPPLAYYTMAIADAVAHGAERVVLICEDRLNPCVNGVETWCALNDVPCRTIGRDVSKALAALYLARIVIASKGSFYNIVFKMSPYPARVYSSWLDVKRYSAVAKLKACDLVIAQDQLGGYISPGTWANTPGQVELMTAYPESAIMLSRAPD